MNSVATATRRFAVLAGENSFDLASPATETVGRALAVAGVEVDPGRHALILRDGAAVSPSAAVATLSDGALVIVVDLTATSAAPGLHSEASTTPARTSWWMLATVSAVLAALSLAGLAHGTSVLGERAGLAVGATLAVGAAATGALWVRRRDDGTATAPVAALLLAMAAAAVAVPALAGGAQLAIAVGLGTAAILFTVLVIAAPRGSTRSMATALALLMVILAGIWSLTLLWGWGIAAAAALSLGLVSPGWRALPPLLLSLPDGWSIHYKAFMTSRWTVRGSVPEDPGPVSMPVVRRAVEDAGTRLVAGIAVLAGVAVLTTPVVLSHLDEAGTVARIGGIVLIGLTVLHLLLAPRHATMPALRWIARGAAVCMLIEVVVAATRTGALTPLILAGVLLVAGALAAVAIVPMSRGMRSVAWSRTADVVEAIAVTLVPAAACVAADMVEIIRRAMAA